MKQGDEQVARSAGRPGDAGAHAMDRRQALKSMSLFVAAATLWSCSRAPQQAASLDADSRLALASEVGDLVLPATKDGPAASAVGVPQFLLLAIDHGLAGTDVPATAEEPDYLLWLKAELDLRANGNFLTATPSLKENALRAVDALAFRDRSAPTPWLKIKHLILIGYYTSEAGGSEVLRYEDLPGEFRGNVEVEPGMKAQSNDWTAVKYG